MKDFRAMLVEAMQRPEEFESKLTDFLTSKDKVKRMQGLIAASVLPQITDFIETELAHNSSPEHIGRTCYTVAEAMGFFIGLAVGPRLRPEKLEDFSFIISASFFRSLHMAITLDNEAFHASRHL